MATKTATATGHLVGLATAGNTVFYSTVAEVIEFTGITPIDFGLEDDFGEDEGHLTADEKLVVLVESWLVGIKSYIDQNRNRDYSQEVVNGTLAEVPPGIHNIALRAAANLSAVALLRRETAIQRVDIATRLKGDEVFTQAIRADLALFPAVPRFSMARARVTSPVDYDSSTQYID